MHHGNRPLRWINNILFEKCYAFGTDRIAKQMHAFSSRETTAPGYALGGVLA